jgi:hypothetical protein
MLKMVEMDENVTLAAQSEEKDGRPVILINKLSVKPEDVDQLPMTWAADAETIIGFRYVKPSDIVRLR